MSLSTFFSSLFSKPEPKREEYVVCPYCLTDNLVGTVTCSKCQKPFTKTYLERYARNELVTAPIIGYTGAGKSVFLDSFLYTLLELQKPEFWPRTLLQPADAETNDWYQGVLRSRNLGLLPPANEKNVQAKRVLIARNIPLWGNRIFAFRDVGGENFESFLFEDFVVDFCIKSQCVIMALDVLAILEDPTRRLDTLFDGYIRTLRENGAKIRNRKALIVLTKGDRLRDIMPQNLCEYLDQDPVRGFLPENSPHNVNLGDINELNTYCRIGLNKLSDQLGNWISKLTGGTQLIELAKDEGIDLSFTLTSGWGAAPELGAKSVPLRMLDPIARLLEYHSREV